MRIRKERNGHYRIFFSHFAVEIELGGFHCGISFRNRYFHLAFPLFQIFISDDADNFGKELSLRVFSWSIWWNLFVDTESWRGDTPKWRRGCFNIPDAFLGKQKYSREIIEERDIQIPMPEGCYDSHIKLCKDTWVRRFGFKKTIMRIDANIPHGIPHEGKGENSYDCGIDHTYGMCCPAKSIIDGVGKIVTDSLKTRIRYGGWSDYSWHKKN